MRAFSKNTLPRAVSPFGSQVRRYALFSGTFAPAGKQGNSICAQCQQIQSNHEIYANIAR
ncbi:hypothetical protein GCM10007879_03680 [Maritalea porphyrae]|uniref:Uncharacterized protein n=1 Tax=Maritalea porphyrae TaxID=880732 RepID=A0ABQ5UMR0_9HYPH|nr:hypothetical protein GCM10007879_03680 [Maritalea porphyrae]